MRVGKKRLGAEFIELFVVDRSALVDPIVNECCATRLRRDHREKGEIIDVKSGVGTGLDFLRKSDKARRKSTKVNEVCAPIL